MPKLPEHAYFRTRDGLQRVRLVKGEPHVEVSENVLRTRDGNRSPAQGDRVGICVDSRDRRSAVPPAGERGTYREVGHEVVSERVVRMPDGTRERRFTLRRTEDT